MHICRHTHIYVQNVYIFMHDYFMVQKKQAANQMFSEIMGLLHFKNMATMAQYGNTWWYDIRKCQPPCIQIGRAHV